MQIRRVNKSKHKLPEYIMEDAERICQMVISKHERAEWVVVDDLLKTERGSGGFGHTEKH